MKYFPKLTGKTLDAVYNWCKDVERLRREDIGEVDRLNTYTTPVRLLYANTTAVGNVGSGEDDLMTYPLPGGILIKNGHYLEIESCIKFAANGNNKRLRVKFGGSTIYDSTAVALDDIAMVVRAVIIRTGTSSQVFYVAVNNAAQTGFEPGTAIQSDATEDLTTAGLAFKCTGEAVSDNDIIQKSMLVRWYPANIESTA